ncbi:hypothetical protein JGI13_01521, partial [Candidatus Kryptonium thompsonii]
FLISCSVYFPEKHKDIKGLRGSPPVLSGENGPSLLSSFASIIFPPLTGQTDSPPPILG